MFLLLLGVAHQRAVLRVRLAAAVPRQRRAGDPRPLRAADDHRDAGVPRGGDQRTSACKVPMLTVFRDHSLTLILGVLIAI